MASTNNMLKKCEGLLGTNDITEWEEGFLQNVLSRSDNGNHPERLTSDQVEILEGIHNKHFGD